MGTETKSQYNGKTKTKEVWRRVERLDEETGEFITTEEVEYVELAQERFLKVDTAFFFQISMMVSGNARLVLSFILQKLSRGTNIAAIKQKDVINQLHLSKASVERSFIELQKVDAIRKREVCQWMLNPQLAVGCDREYKKVLAYKYSHLPFYPSQKRKLEGDEEDVAGDDV